MDMRKMIAHNMYNYIVFLINYNFIRRYTKRTKFKWKSFPQLEQNELILKN